MSKELGEPTFYSYLPLVPISIEMQAFVSDVVAEFTRGTMVEAGQRFQLMDACLVEIPMLSTPKAQD